MTSEVLILNKRAVVLGADSAVTFSGGAQPRYSKTATKIFQLSSDGQVAAAIYGSASLDLVPWELLLKLFRSDLGSARFERLSEYGDAVVKFLSGNDKIFPVELRAVWVERQFDEATQKCIAYAGEENPVILDVSADLDERRMAWSKAVASIRETCERIGVAATLSREPLDLVLGSLDVWRERAAQQIAQSPTLEAVDPLELAELSHRIRYCRPDLLLGGSGLAIAGYGASQIFPSYIQLEVYGHVGNEIFFKQAETFDVTHTGIAMIKPLAQTAMIDVFAEGFGSSLAEIIENKSLATLNRFIKGLREAGASLDEELVAPILTFCHQAFMDEWKRENWKVNYHPLIQVIQSLSIPEMAHLAESLLNLESLKERVTSPSESVGGPIDVAAITKSEGLVWIRRKHYFDPALNLRYANRLAGSAHEEARP